MDAYIFGDSIMRGVMLDSDSGKYFTAPDENFKKISNEFSLSLENKSRFGSTLPKGLKLIDKNLENGLSCDYALVEFGGNDCAYNWQEVSDLPDQTHLPVTPLKAFSDLYREAIGKLKNAGIKPVVMTLPPIDSDAYLNWITRGGASRESILRWLGDENMIYRWHELYSGAIAKIAVETKALCVDIRSAFLERHDFKKLLCRDGMHPNEKGHEVITATFEDFLKQSL